MVNLLLIFIKIFHSFLIMKERSKFPLLHFLIGLLIREAFAFWTGHPWDFEVWLRVGKHVSMGGNPYIILQRDLSLSFSPFNEMESIGYPPLAAYILAASYMLYERIGIDNKYLYYFILKQPMIISDVIIAILFFKYVTNTAMLFWIYNPYGILISSIWGALDPIALLFILLSLNYLKKNKYAFSGFSLGLATSIKTLPIIFMPQMIFSLKSVKERIKFTSLFILTFLASILLPFLVNRWEWGGIYNCFTYQVAFPVYGAISPFLIFEYVKDSMPLWIHNILTTLWIVALILSYIYSIKKKLPLNQAVLITMITFMASRVFASEPWLIYIISLLLLSSKNLPKRQIYTLLIVGFINLTANNTLLLWFISPINLDAFMLAHYLNNTPPYETFRLAVREIAALLLLQELLAIIFNDLPVIYKVANKLHKMGRTTIIVYAAFFLLTFILGLSIDYTVINMVTDWKHVLEKDFFMGLNFLSTYHLLIITLFLSWILTIVILSKKTFIEKVKLFLTLSILAIIASGIALPIFEYLRGTEILAGETLEIIGNFKMDDRVFFVLTILTISALPAISDLDNFSEFIIKLKGFFKYLKMIV